MSSEPYENRRTFDDSSGRRAASPGSKNHRPQPARRRVEPPRAEPLGPSRGPRVAGATGTISFSPPATLACPLVAALDQWIASSVQPAAARWFGEPVVEIRQISAYSCRGMNGNPSARISEHAFGNALDIAAFTLASGRRITVRDGWRGAPEEQGFLRDVQGAACDRFTTVLAPGSNRFHYDHFHFDLMNRRRGARPAIRARCQARRLPRVRARDTHGRGAIRASPARSIRGARARPTRHCRRIPSRLTDKVGHQLPLAIPGEDGED